MSWSGAIVILAYISLFVELVFLHVPSVASSQNLWADDGEYSEELSKANVSTKNWSLMKKVLFLALPIAIIICTFLYPLLRLAEVFSHSYDLWEGSQMTIILGVILIVIGRFVTLRSVVAIRKDNSQVNDEFQLHDGSFYNKSRNPIQLGMYFFGLGLLLLFPNPVFIVGFIFYIFYMHYKIQVEEQYLKVKYGTPYLEYAEKTNRYL